MACCSARCILLATCILQMVATVQRQILDFLGFMWTPIIANFVQILLTILGIFGTYQYKTRYIIAYAVWMSVWLGWNIFVICFYMEAGILSRDSHVLNMGTGSRSWWLVNGAGCSATYENVSEEHDPYIFPTPSSVEGCVIEYFYIESIQAAVQCVLAVIGIIAASFAIYMYTRDDDSCSVKQIRNLPYNIQYHCNNMSSTEAATAVCSHVCQRPMTPRKVKQRSTRSRRGSRRKYSQNPVTKLINASNQNNCIAPNFYPGQCNPSYERSMSQSEHSLVSASSTLMYVNGRPSPIYMNDTNTVI